MTGPHEEGAAEAARQLRALAADLSGQGFAAAYMQAGPYAAVNVVSPSDPKLTERVYTAPADGVWWFWWSWHDRIGPVHDVEAAAFKIAYVLTPNDGPG
jgi:hypothetical protein